MHDRINHIKENLARNRRLIEGKASLAEFEQIKSSRASAISTYQRDSRAVDEVRQKRVCQWLSPYDIELEHDRLRKVRSACKHPGRWLIQDRKFQQWFDPQNDSTPCLWLCGKPGAGIDNTTRLAEEIVLTLSRQNCFGINYRRRGKKSKSHRRNFLLL